MWETRFWEKSYLLALFIRDDLLRRNKTPFYLGFARLAGQRRPKISREQASFRHEKL
jgi:hypothetical protein